ncbi:MAG: glycosyltransferase [Bacteroidota bacterium]
MNWLEILSLIFALLCLGIQLLLIFFWLTNAKSYYKDQEPQISILIAARNEEGNIQKCLDSVLAIDYPNDKIEILVGNDFSEDNTLAIANKIAAGDNRVKVIDIKEKKTGNALGKANVLAQLAKQAKGEIFFITDADIEVPKTWVKSMLRACDEGVAIVTGITTIKDALFQQTEWLYALGMIKVVTDLGLPVTAMGNNMLVTRKAYEAVGGYELVPFSVTEDLELCKQVRFKGFKARNLIEPDLLSITPPTKKFKTLIQQRQRWTKGALQLPIQVVIILILMSLYLPALVILALSFPWLALAIFISKSTAQTIFISLIRKRLNMSLKIIQTFIFDFYSFLISTITTIYLVLPIKIDWKGRKY